MTPPNARNAMVPQGSQAAGVAMTHESPYAESPDHLTFEEMREMPMHMALGFDVSNDE